ncbi:type II toxin-antitoxin system RelE/ParE family toxin [Agrobacterium salinitolerans]
MVHRIAFHADAEAEIDKLYELLRAKAGPVIAGNYVGGIYDLIEGLRTFPERGSLREGKVSGLRVIGYRRRVSIAFTVQGDVVHVLGVFYGGRDAFSLLDERF